MIRRLILHCQSSQTRRQKGRCATFMEFCSEDFFRNLWEHLCKANQPFCEGLIEVVILFIILSNISREKGQCSIKALRQDRTFTAIFAQQKLIKMGSTYFLFQGSRWSGRGNLRPRSNHRWSGWGRRRLRCRSSRRRHRCRYRLCCSRGCRGRGRLQELKWGVIVLNNSNRLDLLNFSRWLFHLVRNKFAIYRFGNLLIDKLLISNLPQHQSPIY